MSMITRCPACHTLFRVVPDQLRISQGWVRCGKCAEVFDGSAALVDEAALALAAAPMAEALPAPTNPTPTPALEPEPPVQALQADRERPDDAAQPLVASTELAFEVLGALDTPAPLAAPPVEPTLDPAVALEAAPAVDAGPAMEMAPPESPVNADAAPSDVSFLRASRRKAFWRKGGVRAVLSLCALLLMAALAVQVALQEHDRIATQWPDLQPALEQLCEVGGCQVGPWRQIDAIVIEGSSFNRLRGDVYRLGLGLRNTLTLALAVPSIELSLTDHLDQTVLRRVLTPQELGLPDKVLSGGQDWSGSVTLQVSLPTGTPRIAGYRVLAFYP